MSMQEFIDRGLPKDIAHRVYPVMDYRTGYSTLTGGAAEHYDARNVSELHGQVVQMMRRTVDRESYYMHPYTVMHVDAARNLWLGSGPNDIPRAANRKRLFFYRNE